MNYLPDHPNDRTCETCGTICDYQPGAMFRIRGKNVCRKCAQDYVRYMTCDKWVQALAQAEIDRTAYAHGGNT